MSFISFSWPVTAAGAVLLAGVLYWIHHLRSRRRVVHLAAASLWSRAVEEAPPRVLGVRFRYWLAYLLATAIVLLLWLAAAHPVLSAARRGGSIRTFYLDASAVLAGGGDMSSAKRTLLADVRGTPSGSREVVLGDAVGTRLLLPGESVSLLARRLDGIGAVERPSRFVEWLRERAPPAPAGQAEVIRYYGAWPLARFAAAAPPKNVALTYGYLAASVPGNRGIVSLGLSSASSGLASKVDVLVELAAAHGPAPGADAMRFTRDGRTTTAIPVVLGNGRFLIRNVDGDGSLFGVALREGDGFPADDHAALRLPDRRPIPVALAAGLPPAIVAAVRADDGFAIVDPAKARVIVKRVGDPTARGLASLVLAPAMTGTDAFAFSGPDEDAHGDLSARLDEFGLAQVDAVQLAERLGRPIGIGVARSPRRTIVAWRELFEPYSGFERSATMPLFVSNGVRWLADQGSLVPYAKADETLPDAAGTDWSGNAVSGNESFPGSAGERRIEDHPIAVSLTDGDITRLVGDASPHPAVSPGGGASLPDPLFVSLVAVAGMLLAGEWLLIRRGWMP